MADMKKGAVENYPLEPLMMLEMTEPPDHSSCSRELAFQGHTGQRKYLTIDFKKTAPLRWESTFANGFDVLKWPRSRRSS